LLFQIHQDSGLTDYQSMANLQFSDIGLDHVDYDKVGNEDRLWREFRGDLWGEFINSHSSFVSWLSIC
jgi:hypothetical protein